MKNNIVFDCNTVYEFGMTTNENERNSNVYENLLYEEKKILDQVIEYAKDALFSRFSDYVYETTDNPHYKFTLKGKAQTHHKEMLKEHKLKPADLPEFMEDMIKGETFVRTEPFNKKKALIKTAFVFEELIKFDENEEYEKVELKFSLDKVVKGVYHMNILAFGKPYKRKKPPKKEKKNINKRKISIWKAA